VGRRVVHLAFLYRADKLTILPTPNTLEYAVAVIKCFGHFVCGGVRRPLTPQNITKFMLAYATSLRHFMCQFTWPKKYSVQRFLANFIWIFFLTFLTRVNKFFILIIKEPKISAIFWRLDIFSFSFKWLFNCGLLCLSNFFKLLFTQRYSGLVLHYPVSHPRRIRFIGFQITTNGTRKMWKCYVVNEVVCESKHNEKAVFTNCLQGKR